MYMFLVEMMYNLTITAVLVLWFSTFSKIILFLFYEKFNSKMTSRISSSSASRWDWRIWTRVWAVMPWRQRTITSLRCNSTWFARSITRPALMRGRRRGSWCHETRAFRTLHAHPHGAQSYEVELVGEYG